MSEPTIEPTTEPTDTEVPDTGGKDWEADAKMWKALARKHENGFKTVSKDLETLRASQMTEAEKAIAEAKLAGRSEALAEVGPRLAKSALATAAAKAGVSLPDERFINYSPLMANGEPDADAITAFVKSLPKSNAPEFTQDVFNGGGASGAGSKVKQLTRADLANMTHEQINAARDSGQLNTLLGIV
ncbi:hypothetical protein [Streptosporangium sp. OZ121]|uniref:hypothetical protein n=1 Tax=Streptosporangium sp. OZ121 TaxID=3444183 RepID=UPI003F7A4F38